MRITNGMLSRSHPAEVAEQSQVRHARRPHSVSLSGPLCSVILGAVLLAWSTVMVLAPELGSLIAIFGSPVVAFFVIVRLLTPESQG